MSTKLAVGELADVCLRELVYINLPRGIRPEMVFKNVPGAA